MSDVSAFRIVACEARATITSRPDVTQGWEVSGFSRIWSAFSLPLRPRSQNNHGGEARDRRVENHLDLARECGICWGLNNPVLIYATEA